MFVQDKLINFLSGLGTDRDKTSYNRFSRHFISKDELDAAYENSWLSAQIIDLPCDDLTREWRKWNGGQRQLRSIETAERQLRVRQRVNHALKMARLYGGAAILIGVDGDVDPSLPLEPESVAKGGIKYLHVLSRWEIWAGEIDRDPFSQFYSEPVYYVVASAGTAPPQLANKGAAVSPKTTTINPNRPMGSLYVHPSRVVRFLGPARLETARAIDGWGISILQRCRDAIVHAESAAGNLASLTHEAKVDVIKIPGFTQNVARDDYRSALTARFALASQAKSIQSMLLLDSLEEWEQKVPHIAGFPEVLKLYMELVAGAADIPVTRLLGTSAKGLNATGAENTRNYYDMLASRQEVELRPGLERLDELLIRHALGTRPSDLDFDWVPLWQMRENEKSALLLQKAQMNQIYATIGAMPKSALASGIQSQLVQDDVYPGMEGFLEVAKLANEPNEPLAQKQDEVGAEINTASPRTQPPKA